MSFWDSNFMKKIETTGELPELPIAIDNDSLVKLAISLLFVSILTILIAYLFFRRKTA